MTIQFSVYGGTSTAQEDLVWNCRPAMLNLMNLL